MEYVAWTEAQAKPAVLERMREVKSGFVTALFMAYPFAIRMYVRRIGVARYISKISFRRPRCSSAILPRGCAALLWRGRMFRPWSCMSRRAMRGNISAANVASMLLFVSALLFMSALLRVARHQQRQGQNDSTPRHGFHWSVLLGKSSKRTANEMAITVASGAPTDVWAAALD